LGLVLNDERTFQRLVPNGIHLAYVLKALAQHPGLLKAVLTYVLDRPIEFQQLVKNGYALDKPTEFERLVTDGVELGFILKALAEHPDLVRMLLLYVLKQPGEFQRLCTGLDDLHCILTGLTQHPDLAEIVLRYILKQPSEFRRLCTDLTAPYDLRRILDILVLLGVNEKYKTIFDAKNRDEALDRVSVYADRQEIKKNVIVLNELAASGRLPVPALFITASYTAQKLSLKEADKVAYAFFKKLNPHWSANSKHELDRENKLFAP
jgi:hypothetical protein